MGRRLWIAVAFASGCFVKPSPPAGAPVDAAPADAAPAPNAMFVTSVVVPLGNGVPALDTLCTTLASEANPPLSGTYLAWFSTHTTDASARLANARGWVRTDGKPFVDSVADLVAGRIWYPARLDENGNDLGADVGVATGTHADGTDFSGTDCGDAMGDGGSALGFGITGAGAPDWTDVSTVACSMAMHLYCFGVDRSATVAPPPPAAGPKVFVSTQIFFPKTDGVTVADMMCMNEALESNITGMFVAVLATDSTTVVAKLGATTAPWARLDGVPTTSDFTTFTAPIDVDVSGAYVGETSVYTGAATGFGLGDMDCADWMSTAAGETYVGDTARGGSDAFDASMGSCTAQLPVYCAEMR